MVIDYDDEGIGIKTGCHRLRTLVLVVVCHVGLIRWVEMDVRPFIPYPGLVAIDPSYVIPVEAFPLDRFALLVLRRDLNPSKNVIKARRR